MSMTTTQQRKRRRTRHRQRQRPDDAAIPDVDQTTMGTDFPRAGRLF